MGKRVFAVRFDYEVEVEIDQRVIDAIDDDWRATFYSDVQTPADVARHIAFAMKIRGFLFSQLDGFNGLPEAKIHEGPCDVDVTEVTKKHRGTVNIKEPVPRSAEAIDDEPRCAKCGSAECPGSLPFPGDCTGSR